jgi:hypothetical protein
MMHFDAAKLRTDAQEAETPDLLDRITAYREGMEAAAIEVIEAELRRRGVNQAAIDAHAEERRRECIFDGRGVARRCSRCHRPAVAVGRGWHRLWGVLPLFPRSVLLCREHRAPTS